MKKFFFVLRRRRVRVRRKKAPKKEYLENKEKARALVIEKLNFWREQYIQNHGIDLKWNKLAIRNTVSRWGSCSSKKNLNFSYKILFLTPPQQDYLIVHELCHLKEMNHSKNFWDLVAFTIPNYKNVRNSMKNFGATIS